MYYILLVLIYWHTINCAHTMPQGETAAQQFVYIADKRAFDQRAYAATCQHDDVACRHLHELLYHSYTILAATHTQQHLPLTPDHHHYTPSDIFFFYQLNTCAEQHDYEQCFQEMIALLIACKVSIHNEIKQ